MYFDVDGNFYASNNSNGYVFKVSINGTSSSAEFFTYGPSSSSNEGARCALAPAEPTEYMEASLLLEAYDKFDDYAQDASGRTEPTWYENFQNNKIFID